MKQFWIYILSNYTNAVIYIGVTNNLERRVFEHKNKLINGFTKKYNLNKLVYFDDFSSIEDAIAAEKKLKGWIRKRKNELIESKNPEWKDLSVR